MLGKAVFTFQGSNDGVEGGFTGEVRRSIFLYVTVEVRSGSGIR